ncbi:Agamous-like MADS-box protein AGL62 [Striga hermonthica]|uniref:Agamous-like MADS-box protein AGL62 n=1 Tax=Striga hermonthica TaxID=68872 RepID=A0A9N7ML27_STRHE|nr:Agamous-like MADS-box protein AGL62 [Striga hermonthica]
MGRQKIKIEKIEVKNHLQVTFSKRRSGLFKKASELCTLCGVEIAIIVFSPAGKVFSFGHPNVESIVDRFLARGPAHGPSPVPGPFHLVEAHRNASVRELNMQLGQILNELEAERKRGEELDGMRKTGQSHYWWEGPIDKLGLDELEQLRDAMEELKRNVAGQEDDDAISDSSCPSAMSSFQKNASSSYNNGKKTRKNLSKRESLASSSSEFTMGSPSYGSFTTFEKIPVKNANGEEEIITPVRRSNRIKNYH